MNERKLIGISPFHAAGLLRGFVVSGRWPDTTKEWAQFLALAVQVASMPGLLATSTVFGVRDELPDDPEPGVVGLVLADGPVVGETAVTPGRIRRHRHGHAKQGGSRSDQRSRHRSFGNAPRVVNRSRSRDFGKPNLVSRWTIRPPHHSVGASEGE